MNESPTVKLLPFSPPAITIKEWYYCLFSHLTVKQVPVSSDHSCLVQNRGCEFDTVTNALAYNDAELIKQTCMALQYRPDDVILTQ